MAAEILLAGKAYDADARVIKPLAQAGKTIVIPQGVTVKSPDFMQAAL